MNHYIFAGDFNFQFYTNRYKFICDSLKNHDVVIVDEMRLPDDSFTYVSDAHNSVSWLDHVLSNQQLSYTINRISVEVDYVSSDHRPMTFDVSAKVSCDSTKEEDLNTVIETADWKSCNKNMLFNYSSHLSQLLKTIDVPNFTLNSGVDCDYKYLINQYYIRITDCIKSAMRQHIPFKKCGKFEQCVAGWNEVVDDKHVAARSAFIDWVTMGKPRVGYEFELMKRTRAKFKLALRYCKFNEEMFRCNALARDFLSKSEDFWRKVRKSGNRKMTKFSNSVNGASGDEAIVAMWKKSYENLYNPPTEKVELLFENEMITNENNIDEISVAKLFSACSNLKIRKAVGPDGIPAEAIKYGGHVLLIHLSLIFGMFLKYSYLPTELMQTTLMPLLKNKTENLSDVNNYRAIALSNSISKLLEDVLLNILKQYESSDDLYQFGFKKEHSTAMGCSVLKRVIDYYRRNGSYVFACFLDLTKAFDRVNHKTLFYKMTKLGYPSNIVKLLVFWYSHQLVNVRWKNLCSTNFRMSIGTRQGSVLSPYLFSIYIRDFSNATTMSGIGCHIGTLCCNILLYADDMVLLSPSWKSLHKLLDICVDCSVSLGMIFNTAKSVAMIFAPYDTKRHVNYQFPSFKISGETLQNVNIFKYLGHLISDDLYDDDDIVRQMGLLYGRTNFLCRKFSNCSIEVKITLFRTYCLSFYCMSLWERFHKKVLNRIEAAYVKCIKMFFGFERLHSVTAMFMQLKLPTFNTLLHNSKLKFLNTCKQHSNNLVSLVHLIT